MYRNSAYRASVLQAVNEFWEEYYRPPTVREIKDLTGINSTSTISRVLGELHEDGKIVLSGGKGKSRTPIPLWVKDAVQKAKAT